MDATLNYVVLIMKKKDSDSEGFQHQIQAYETKKVEGTREQSKPPFTFSMKITNDHANDQKPGEVLQVAAIEFSEESIRDGEHKTENSLQVWMAVKDRSSDLNTHIQCIRLPSKKIKTHVKMQHIEGSF
jgi:hypothetical protein